MVIVLAVTVFLQSDNQIVSDADEFRKAMASAKPGRSIFLQPGDYPGGFHFRNVNGTAGKPIVIRAMDPNKPPRFVGGGNAIQLSDCSYLEIRDIVAVKQTGNGLNIDDGGSLETPTHHITLKNIRISDLPKGNNDGIKLSGLDDFRVENCVVERWGGSGIDMVGCHRGVIVGCTFRNGGDSGVQCKGGTSSISIQKSRFEEFGQRGVNIGGSTGLPYFRPPIAKMPSNARYEAKDIRVEGCTFTGGVAPISFVGVDGAVVRFNTIYNPERWAIRILQETRTADFTPSRNGVFEDNLVVFQSSRWASGGVNVGSGTSPETFSFARNFWFCLDNPARSKPNLPTQEKGGIVGLDPRLIAPERGDLGVRAGSPASKVGAHSMK